MAKTEEGASRRDFLKVAATTAPIAAAAAAVGTTAGAAEVDPTSEKMQDTAHTRAYFKTAQF